MNEKNPNKKLIPNDAYEITHYCLINQYRKPFLLLLKRKWVDFSLKNLKRWFMIIDDNYFNVNVLEEMLWELDPSA